MFGKTVTSTPTEANINIIARGGNQTRDIWHRRMMRYFWTTKASEHIGWSQAIKLFQQNWSNTNQQT